MEQCAAIEDKHEILPLRSPSSWSYDALTRTLNLNKKEKNKQNNFYKNANNGSANSIISLLNECEFSPLPRRNSISDYDNGTDTSYESYESVPSDITSKLNDINTNDDNNNNTNNNNNNNTMNNNNKMMAGLVLLCISGVLDAGTIAYVNWLTGVGFNMEEILMYQGIVQIILCFFFGIITAKVMSQHSSHITNKTIHRNISFRSLVLPFSMEYNVNFVNLFKSNVRKKQTFTPIIQESLKYRNKYGTMNSNIQSVEHTNINNIQNNTNPTKKQLIIALISFGIIQFTSHLTYFYGYLKDDSDNNKHTKQTNDHFAIAPLFNSFAIVLAFLWSYCVFPNSISLNSEVLFYLLLMYIGVFISGYSFMKYSKHEFGLILRISNIYLIISAFCESLGYVLIKFLSNIPTFILVFSQSIFCCLLGLILFQTSNESFVALNSFSDVIEMSSVGLIGFWSTWSFVRGTQLINIGTASFLKMTFFIIFSIIIQVFSIDGKIPHFYCIFGLCLILLSIILMLIEKFSKFRQ